MQVAKRTFRLSLVRAIYQNVLFHPSLITVHYWEELTVRKKVFRVWNTTGTWFQLLGLDTTVQMGKNGNKGAHVHFLISDKINSLFLFSQNTTLKNLGRIQAQPEYVHKRGDINVLWIWTHSRRDLAVQCTTQYISHIQCLPTVLQGCYQCPCFKQGAAFHWLMP